MPGVRLRHPTLRGCVLLIPDLERPLRAPYPCPTCLEPHACKTYHLALDGEGAVIVSPEIWDRLRRLETGLELENEVRRPPRLVVGGSRREERRIIRLTKEGHADG